MLVAWLLIDQNGSVVEVQLEKSSGDPTFDEGSSLSRFRPAERFAVATQDAEPASAQAVSVWMEYPYSITWIAGEPGGPGDVSGDH